MKRNNRIKKVPTLFLAFLLLVAGIGLILYPSVSNRYNQYLQDSLIMEQDHSVAVTSPEVLAAEQEACILYNSGLLGNVVLTDPFDAEAIKDNAEEYQERLNLNGDGIMGSIEIPMIGVRLAIYHGTDSGILEQGVGHLENTSLPVGGEGTHAVLSAHTAYAKATLFNDLIKLKEGDLFFLKVLNETLAYRVDQIEVVVPEDTSLLHIDGTEDYVTLVTCTPYGINSHRLLVRGVRTDYVEAPEEEPAKAVTWNRWYIAAGLVPVGILIGYAAYRQKKKIG